MIQHYTMKTQILIVLLALTYEAVARVPELRYHEDVGIPLAERIKQAEEAGDYMSSRIVGGSPSPVGAHPYLIGTLISIPGDRTSVCGSCMLSNTKAVTAAHCWFDGWTQALRFTLVFGARYLFIEGVRVDTTMVEMHAGWNTRTLENDIAVITFNWVSYTNIIQPIALPTGSLLTNDFTGYWATASVFGRTGDGFDHNITPDQFQSRVTLQVITNEECRQSFRESVFDSTLCTSGAQGTGVCSSDSGGPLSININNRMVLIGIVSFGSLQCEARRPNGFARVTSYVSWIQQRL